jgi:hypothetical protein
MQSLFISAPHARSTQVQDTEIFAPQETCEPKLVPRPQTIPMHSPVVISNGQQESTNEYEPEDSNTGRRTSGRVRKRTQVDVRCECDTEIMNEEIKGNSSDEVQSARLRNGLGAYFKSCLASSVLMGDTHWTCASYKYNSTKCRRYYRISSNRLHVSCVGLFSMFRHPLVPGYTQVRNKASQRVCKCPQMHADANITNIKLHASDRRKLFQVRNLHATGVRR